MKLSILAACGLLLPVSISCVQAQETPVTEVAPLPTSKTNWKFAFGSKAAGKDAISVAPTAVFSPQSGYGFEPGNAPTQSADGAGSDKPFLFSAIVPEGNYRVTIVLGDKTRASTTTVKAESKRLMLEAVPVEAGKTVSREFTVNMRSTVIAGSKDKVRLKPREDGRPHWDDKLTFEFLGARPAISSLEIAPETNPQMVFLAGDSTVTDQQGEPFAAWGQMLPRFFKPGVSVLNMAESGLTLGSFRAQNRLKKIVSLAKAGDFVFVQFGHNDQKEKGEDKGPFKSYKTNLLDYVEQIRKTGATPVLLTPMERRRYADGQFSPTLTDYAEAVRQVADEQKVALIDLNSQSLVFYRALGGEKSKRAFVFAAAGEFPGRSEAIADNTHFSNYGAYEIARIVVEGIRTNVPALAEKLTSDAGRFDPAKPDAVETFPIPLSVSVATEKPAGS